MTATDFNTLLAKNDGTTLVSHTTAVKNMAIALCENVNDDINFKKRCVTAAVLHDIGKCTNEFQNDLKISDCPTIIRHNIISWAVSCCCFPNNSVQRQISNAVLYHHVVPVGADSETKAFDIYQALTDDEKNLITDFYNAFDDVIPMSAEVEMSTSDYTQIPLFDITKSKSNGVANCNDEEALLLRAILITADRIVSSNEYDNIRIEHNDVDYMKTIIEENNNIKSIDGFDTQSALEHTYDMTRLRRQIDIVDESLSALNNDKNTIMVNASAGFGKTLLGLISILKRRRKTVWCVPTREIAMSTFSSICDELKKMKCPLSVCLFYGNEIQDTFTISKNTQDCINIKNFDIVVSVIDSMLSRFHNNNSGHLLYSLLTDDVIFDEYHNVVTDNALFAAASLLWDTRICKTDAYSLFLSATPLFPIQPIIKNTDKIKTFDPPKYKGDIKINFHYVENVSDITYFMSNSFIITNTVAQAQNMYLKLKREGYKNVMLYHAQYEKNDMAEIRKRLFDNFGKNTPASDMIVVCTGIIGTGLDLSARNIYDYTLTPSDTLQRVCGRASRFGEYKTIDYFLCDIDDDDRNNIGKGNSIFVRNVYNEMLRTNFINGMKGNDRTIFTKNELYDKVNKFNMMFSKNIYSFYVEKMKDSRDNLSKITLRKTKSANDNNTKYTSKQTTLRGTGKEVFVAIPHDDSYVLFTMDSERAKRIEREYDDASTRKFRMKFYKKHNIYQKNWKYKYGLKDGATCNFDTCVDLAYCSDTPLPLHNMKYSKELGAYEI